MRLIDADALSEELDRHIEHLTARERYGLRLALAHIIHAKTIEAEPVRQIESQYKWHDLRKNPEDLPMHDGMYIVAQQSNDDPVETGFGQYENMYGYGAGWSALTSYGYVIAWREIEPFEVIE